jgi:hypothetical protein
MNFPRKDHPLRPLSVLAITACLLLAASPLSAQGSVDSTDTGLVGWLPFAADWAREQGINVPLPFGAGINLVYMSRDIEVTDVNVQFLDQPPESISDFASFAVHNQTIISAVRLDAWVLPLLNIYGMAGYTATNSSLDARFTIDRPLHPPEDVVINEQSRIGGPFIGGGATVVAGYGHWFVMGDGSYGYVSLDEFEGGIDYFFYSGRTGWSGTLDFGTWRSWIGFAYMMSEQTLTVIAPSEILGDIRVEIDQRPVNPWTAQIGAGVSVGKRWEFVAEVGSNFDDAFIGVFSGTFRF